ncbi:flexible cuticle protein 12-like [Bicyclus anynana]|uniref:Flexible cuticle protein 12-like n=1 Tax=Bicyclus anynana TaxID=110368 RepID=A0A6J1P8P5_BICAN|nr:flexible cuticle protein 12-like [Bicyclus anynana]
MFKMRCLYVFCFIMLVANALPIDKDSEAKITSNEYVIDETGNYRFSFETSNGITRDEIGTIVNKGQPNEYISVKGRFSYINTEGIQEFVEYSADENGYTISPPIREEPISGVPPSLVASLLGK